MTPDQLLLSRQLAGLPGFRWEAGMKFPQAKGKGWIRHAGRVYDDEKYTPCDAIPDLTDDAIGGVLFGWICALDDEAHLDRSNGALRITVHGYVPCASTDHVDRDDHGGRWWTVTGATLAEASARALLAIGRCA